MNFDDTPEEAVFRSRAREWIAANAPVELAPALAKVGFGQQDFGDVNPIEAGKEWQRKKYDAGWAALRWPKEYGGAGASAIEQVIWSDEEGVYGRLGSAFVIGFGMCGPTVMEWADEDAKRELLPKLASGEEIWCQLFSEPAAGSDLAGIRTRAVRDGDEWVVNGQKIWTSGAAEADWGLLITRTDPTLAKHRGLTMFYVSMHAPGVEVRPIKQINGDSHFNEVYFSDVRIPDTQRLGEVGQGWSVALTTLMNERASIGGGMPTGFDELFEFASQLETEDGLAIDDRRVRSQLARFAVKSRGLRYSAFRSMSALSRGEMPGPENSIGKLVAGSMLQAVARYALDLQGEYGVILETDRAADGARFQRMLMRSPATRIEGGSDEILRNIIAERVLGLPADIRADKDVPFDKIPTAS